MAYEQHTWTTGETITAEKMNNIEEGIGEAASSTGYDIVFRIKKGANDFINLDDITVADITLVSGSIQALEEKLLSGEGVTGLFEVFSSYNEAGYDTYYSWRLALFDVPYAVITFAGGGNNGTVNLNKVTLGFNSSTYALSEITFGQ